MEHEPLTIRRASLADSEEIKRIDHVAAVNPERVGQIDNWLRNDVTLVAEYSERIVGYGVFNHNFFHHGQVDMLMVDQDLRGRKIGEALLLGLEKLCDTPKFFVTTNLSNTRMQRLLVKSGFRISGFIGDLDPGYPELVFVKNLGVNNSLP